MAGTFTRSRWRGEHKRNTLSFRGSRQVESPGMTVWFMPPPP